MKLTSELVRRALGLVVGGAVVVGGMSVITFDNGQTALENVMSKVSQLSTNVNDLQGQKTTLLGNIGTKNKAIKGLNDEITTLKAQLEELVNSGNADQTLIDQLKAQIQGLEDAKSELEGELATLEGQLATLQEELNASNQENENLKEAFAQQQTEMQKAIEEVQKLSDSVEAIETTTVEALPNLDDIGLDGEVVTPPPTDGEGEQTPQDDKVWDLNKLPQVHTYKGLTFTRTEVGGQVFFQVDGDSTNVGKIELSYKDAEGLPKTTVLKVGQNNIIPNPPHTYNNIKITYSDFTSATITFVNMDK